MLFFAASLVLALTFRRNREWRSAWLPTLLAAPAALVVGIPFSALGSAGSSDCRSERWAMGSRAIA